MPVLASKKRRGSVPRVGDTKRRLSSSTKALAEESDGDDDVERASLSSSSSSSTASTLSAETRKAPKPADTDEIGSTVLRLLGLVSPLQVAEKARLAAQHEYQASSSVSDVVIMFLAEMAEEMVMEAVNRIDNQLLLLALADFSKLGDGHAALLSIGVNSNGGLPESYVEEFQPSPDSRRARARTLFKFLKINCNEPRSPLHGPISNLVRAVEAKCVNRPPSTSLKEFLRSLNVQSVVKEMLSFYFSFASADSATLAQIVCSSLAFQQRQQRPKTKNNNGGTSDLSEESEEDENSSIEGGSRTGETEQTSAVRLRSVRDLLNDVRNLLSLSRLSAVLVLQLKLEISQKYGRELYELHQKGSTDEARIQELEDRLIETSPSPVKFCRQKLLENETVPYLQILANYLAAGTGPEWRRRV